MRMRICWISTKSIVAPGVAGADCPVGALPNRPEPLQNNGSSRRRCWPPAATCWASATPTPFTAATNLAGTLQAQGELGQARELQEEVLGARRDVLGPAIGHPVVASGDRSRRSAVLPSGARDGRTSSDPPFSASRALRAPFGPAVVPLPQSPAQPRSHRCESRSPALPAHPLRRTAFVSLRTATTSPRPSFRATALARITNSSSPISRRANGPEPCHPPLTAMPPVNVAPGRPTGTYCPLSRGARYGVLARGPRRHRC